MTTVHLLVQLPQKRDRLKILVAAERIGDPLPVGARVVEVQHGGDAVDAQRIRVECLQPEERAARQEIAHLSAAVVEDRALPFRVKPLPRIRVLVQMRAVEVGEPMLVVRKMRRHPIKDHPQSALVQAINEIHEILRGAVARGRREISRDLISPRAVERMLHDRQELHVREAHVERMVAELVGELPVGERAVIFSRNAAPRA